MLTSVQFATKLFVTIVGVYVCPLTIVCIHFFAIGCFAAEPGAIEFLCSVCGQVLRSVGLLAVQAGTLAVLIGPVLHAALAEHVLAVSALFRLEDYFLAHRADELVIQSADDVLFFQFWQSVGQLNPLVSRPQRAFLPVNENFELL